jgi:hypothetical protein
MSGSGSSQAAAVAHGKHLRVCLWFWAWAAVGAVGAVGLVSLGPIALGPAIIAGAAMTRLPSARQSAFGLSAGAGLVCLFVAFAQRQGPETTCWHTATAGGCDQHLNPIPWLIVGVILVLGALVAQARHTTN